MPQTIESRRRGWRAQARVRKSERPQDCVVHSASPELLAERDRRRLQPLTFDQLYLGDPPPGRSALDQKREAACAPAVSTV